MGKSVGHGFSVGDSDHFLKWEPEWAEYKVTSESSLTVDNDATTDSTITFETATGFITDSIVDPSAEITTFNYDAVNLWWQMEHLPSYLKGW